MKKIIALGASLLLISTSYAGLYRWVDDAGEVHFSDKIPVAVSQKAHSEINKHGITKKNIDPDAAKKAQEEIRLKEQEALEKQILAQQKFEKLAKERKKDEYLLSTYENEQELVRYFENKIKLIKGNSSVLTIQNNVLTKKVAKLEKKMAVNKDELTQKALEKRVIDINQTIKQYDKALLENDNEIIELSKSYKVDYKRFTELNQ